MQVRNLHNKPELQTEYHSLIWNPGDGNEAGKWSSDTDAG